MEEIPDNYRETYVNMEQVTKLGFPAPKSILDADLNMFLGGTRIWELPWILERLYVKKGENGLDIGCGTSIWPIYLAGLGYDVTAIDNRFKGKALNKFKAYVKKQVLPGIEIKGSVKYTADNMTNITLKKTKNPIFDFATCVNVLDNVSLGVAVATVKQAAKQLKTGAPLFITMGNIHNYFSADSLETYFKRLQSVKGFTLQGYKKLVTLKQYLKDNPDNHTGPWDKTNIFGFILIKIAGSKSGDKKK